MRQERTRRPLRRRADTRGAETTQRERPLRRAGGPGADIEAVHRLVQRIDVLLSGRAATTG